MATNKHNFTAYKLLIADVIDVSLKAVPRGVMAVKSHLAKYYEKMGEAPPWERG